MENSWKMLMRQSLERAAIHKKRGNHLRLPLEYIFDYSLKL